MSPSAVAETTKIKLKAELLAHKAAASSVCEVKSGVIASVGWDEQVFLWQPEKKWWKFWSKPSDTKPFRCFGGHRSYIHKVLSLDADTLLTASEDGTLRVFNLKLDDVDLIANSKRAEVHEVSINDGVLVDRFTVATASADMTSKIIDTQTLAVKQTLNSAEDTVNTVTMTTQGLLALGSEDRCIYLFDLRQGPSPVHILKGHKQGITALGTAEEYTFLSGGRDGKIGVYDQRKNFSLLKPISAHTSDVLCLAYLGSGRIASGSQDKSVRIWDGNINYGCVRTLMDHESWVTDLKVLSNGDIATASVDCVVRIYG